MLKECFRLPLASVTTTVLAVPPGPLQNVPPVAQPLIPRIAAMLNPAKSSTPLNLGVSRIRLWSDHIATSESDRSPNPNGMPRGVFLCGATIHAPGELLVWMARFTAVIGLPAGTTEGENVHVAPGGRPETEMVTGTISVAEPTGATKKLKPANSPAITVCVEEPASFSVKSATFKKRQKPTPYCNLWYRSA